MIIPLQLVDENHPALHAIATPVQPEEMDALIAQFTDIRRFMVKHRGAGLAAPQLGVTKRFFVWQYGVVINPEIISRSPVVVSMAEGCLSYPMNAHAFVSRPKGVQVRYTDENKRIQEKFLTAMPARIFQHEFDHLNGITIY